MADKCNGICPPLIIYLVLAFAGLLLEWTQRPAFQSYSLYSLIIHLTFIGLWSLLIWWLCTKCYIKTAYLIVFLPVVILFGLVFAFASGIFLRRFI